MNEEKNFDEGYAFSFTDCDGKQYVFGVNQEGTPWPEVLNDFVNFISNVYGYDIKKSIRIEAPRCHKYGAQCEWGGEFFDSEDDWTDGFADDLGEW